MKTTYYSNKTKTYMALSIFVLSPFLLLFTSGQVLADPRVAEDPVVLIADDNNSFIHAVWSPQGDRIAFTSDNHNGIWIADSNGENIRLLTPDQGAGFGFSWSPDGKYILARATITENRRRFQEVKLYDTRNFSYHIIQEKTRGISALPFWAGNGQHVGFVKDRQLQLVQRPDAGTNRSAERQNTVFPIMDKMISHDHATRESKEIAQFENRIIFDVSYNEDGSKVAFQVQGKGLYVMNADGSGLIELGHADGPAWMPGSKYIIVAMTEDDGYNIMASDLYAIDVNTGQRHLLTAHTEITALRPHVSSSGRWIAFHSPEDGNIYKMAIEW